MQARVRILSHTPVCLQNNGQINRIRIHFGPLAGINVCIHLYLLRMKKNQSIIQRDIENATKVIEDDANYKLQFNYCCHQFLQLQSVFTSYVENV